MTQDAKGSLAHRTTGIALNSYRRTCGTRVAGAPITYQEDRPRTAATLDLACSTPAMLRAVSFHQHLRACNFRSVRSGALPRGCGLEGQPERSALAGGGGDDDGVEGAGRG